ncbi:hypothetical protein EXN66_Car007825 [Channa argus]|uniref:Apolipoprotein C-I n=1 Tax=Channa argus TaxID=215402 RepID=A0A6G1PPJ8_CHAAH|nr:hypothetical protein EXN66_Car007825 [Channa argus]
MRLYLAVAMLMLAFVAYTEAQEDTIQDKFSQFGDKLTDLGRQVADHAKTAYDQFQNSKAGQWFTDNINKLKAKIGEIGQ